MPYQILVVEDEDIIRKGIICSVDWYRIGCGPVMEARNGKEALELIRTGAFDIVLMDVNMPLMSGLDTLEQTYREFNYVPILLTGYSDFDFARRALSYGAVSYLLKPVDIDELVLVLEKAKKERDRRRAYTHYQNSVQARLDQPNLLPETFRDKDTDDIINKMFLYIDQKYDQKITLPMLSLELFYSETAMIRSFKKATGLNFTEYLSRYRIQRAITMLQAGEGAKISDIASACGFSDYKYFNTIFKKYIGCSAKEYMKQMYNG